MTKLGKQRVRLRSESWAHPGEEQTLDDLLRYFKDKGQKILAIDEDGQRVLVSFEEQEIDIG